MIIDYQSIAPLFNIWHWFENVLGAVMWSLIDCSDPMECLLSLLVSIGMNNVYK